MRELNVNEKEFMKELEIADSHVPESYELEIDHFNGLVPGWYAMKYSKERGEAIFLDEYSTESIITDSDAKEKGIDVVKCLDEYDCYYVE